jgi:hypothetical protein
MTEEARGEWLAVAWETLKHLPADMLHVGCRKARETADHPSKIVPIIVVATDEWLASRRNARAPVATIPEARRIEKQSPPLTDDEIKRLPPHLIEMGIKVGEISQERAERILSAEGR